MPRAKRTIIAKLYDQWLPIFMMLGLMCIFSGVVVNYFNPAKGWDFTAAGVQSAGFLTILGSAVTIVKQWKDK